MKTWADFYSFCHADVPGVSVFAAERELRRAAREFCEKTKVWKADLEPVFLTPKVQVYDLDTPRGAIIVKVSEARMDGHLVDLLTEGAMYRAGLLFLSPTQFRLVQPTSAKKILYLRAILVPNHESLGIDNRLFDQYAEAIAAGAKARLYLQPEKDYTNPALAAIEQERFDHAINRERIEAAKGYSAAPLRTKASFI